MDLPLWTLSKFHIQAAKNAGFEYQAVNDRWTLERARDKAFIWPVIDGFMSTFIRDGMFVKHKKFYDLDKALTRRFGDTNVREDEMYN